MKILILLNKLQRIEPRAHRIAQTLLKAGHTVTVITRKHPEFPAEENIDGVSVHRVIEIPRLPPPFKQIALSRRWVQAALKYDADAYQATNLDTLFEAYICARKKKKPLIYDSQELFLETTSLAKRRLARIRWARRERSLIHKCDGVLVTNKWRLKAMQEWYQNIPNPFILDNYPSKTIPLDIASSRHLIRKRHNIGDDEPVFLYQGALNTGRGIERFVEGLKHATNASSAKYIFLGGGHLEKKIPQWFAGLGLSDNLIFPGRVPYQKLEEYLSASDIGIVLFENTGLNNYYSSANKLYEYLKFGNAVIACNFPTITDVVTDSEIGATVDPTDPAALADSIDNFIKRIGQIRSARHTRIQLVQTKYNWEAQKHNFIKWYDRVTTQ